MNTQTQDSKRFIILNHGTDGDLSGNGRIKRGFGSLNSEGKILFSEDVEVYDEEGRDKHKDWSVLFYNCVDKYDCFFYQRVIAEILEKEGDSVNPPFVFIHRGKEELKSSRVVTDWRFETVGRNPIEDSLADQLDRLKAPGVPMSRGGHNNLGWPLDITHVFDKLMGCVKDETFEADTYQTLFSLNRSFQKGLEYYAGK